MCRGQTHTHIHLPSATCTEGDVRLCIGDACVVTETQDFLINNRLSVGRVEVCLEGRFGTVCRDSWENNDASVLCSELGFSRYGAIALSDAQFSEGLKPTSYNEINCVGNESRLSDCAFVGPAGAQSCGRFQDAEVVCQSECVHCLPNSVFILRVSRPSHNTVWQLLYW